LCAAAPISVITIHLWVSVHKSEIDSDIKDLTHLRQLVIPSAASIIGFWSYTVLEVYGLFLWLIQR
jgi:hypothetical protein